jgi:hypothetical protein
MPPPPISQYHHHHNTSNDTPYQMNGYDFIQSSGHHQNSFPSASSTLGFQHPSFASQTQVFNTNFNSATQGKFS